MNFIFGNFLGHEENSIQQKFIVHKNDVESFNEDQLLLKKLLKLVR